MTKGWKGNSQGHSLASRGIKSKGLFGKKHKEVETSPPPLPTKKTIDPVTKMERDLKKLFARDIEQGWNDRNMVETYAKNMSKVLSKTKDLTKGEHVFELTDYYYPKELPNNKQPGWAESITASTLQSKLRHANGRNKEIYVLINGKVPYSGENPSEYTSGETLAEYKVSKKDPEKRLESELSMHAPEVRDEVRGEFERGERKLKD